MTNSASSHAAPSAVSSALPVGSEAPDVTLGSTAGGTVQLASFRGQKNVLLAFFPLAFTSTCTAEVCAFSEDFDQFAQQDVVVLPVSVDAVPSLQEFKRKYNMQVDLLSDMKRIASRAFGVLREEAYVSQRAYFLIGKDGVIKWSHVETKSGERRENSEILAAIAANI
jgi:peroxiredoxin